MRWKRHFAVALLIVFMGLPALLSIEGCPSKAPVVAEKVNLGIHRGPHSSLIYIALDRGFFTANGIDVSIQEYEAGRPAADALLAGNVDIATAPEFVHVSKGFLNPDLRILATISAADDQEIVARKDRGVASAKDLKGKRIATIRDGISGFFLGTFLTFNDIPQKSIKAVHLLPSEMLAAISEGRVDAVSTFPPHTRLIKSSLGPNAVSWPSQNGQSYYFVLMTKEGFIPSHSGLIQRILLSLIEAERFLRENEAQARKIIEGRLNMDPATLSSIWPLYRFRVRLDQDLMILMESEARWMIHNNLSGGREMPDYFKQIYTDGLIAVDPNSVGLIR